MQTTPLGNSGIEVCSLGVGTWSWGDKLFWGYGGDYNASDVRKAFDATLAAGGNFFDTAEVYGLGESETLLGQFMQETDQPVQIATKYAPWPWRLTAQSVSDAITDSLKRLQLEQVTLYQVHWPYTFFMSQETLMNALADEVQRGRITTVGVSNYSAEEMGNAYEILRDRDIPLAVNQVEYSLLSRKIESNGIRSLAKELNITLLAYSPLAKGLLTGKYTPDSDVTPSGARRFDPKFSEDGLQKIAPVINLLKQYGEKYDKTPAQVALNWLIAQDNVIPIPGAKTAKHATQNAVALGWSLDAEEVSKLEQATRPWLK
jgi:aryl-alcohol dehydrogenase-like predicted oxidoreductase